MDIDLKQDVSGLFKPFEAILNRPLLIIAAGSVLIVVATIMLFGGTGSERNSEKALQQGQRAVSQLAAPIDSFRRLMLDEQVQSMAAMGVSDAARLVDLKQYLVGRMREAVEVRR